MENSSLGITLDCHYIADKIHSLFIDPLPHCYGNPVVLETFLVIRNVFFSINVTCQFADWLHVMLSVTITCAFIVFSIVRPL